VLARALERDPRPSARRHAIASLLADALEADRCLIGQPEGGTVRAVGGVAIGIAAVPGHDCLPQGCGITARAVREAHSQRVDDVRLDPDYFPAADSTRSELATPVVSAGQVVAVLNVEADRVAAFTVEDEVVLEAAAAYLADRPWLLGL
jgi:GAF domain-containing protein